MRSIARWKMKNEELIKALRHCGEDVVSDCNNCPLFGECDSLEYPLLHAADALEAAENRIAGLETEVERIKALNEELREKQTYIDHWGDKWMTSGKDVPTAAYNHGFIDGVQSCNCGADIRKGEEK